MARKPQWTDIPDAQDSTSDRWMHSILVGPQTAGIPIAQTEFDGNGEMIGSDSLISIPNKKADATGGAVNYLHSQRKRR